MANKNQETRTKIDDLNDSLTRAEQKVQDNKKLIMWISIVVAAIIAIVLIVIYAVVRPGQNKSNEQTGQVDNRAFIYEMQQSQLGDSLQTAELKQLVAAYEAAASNGYAGGNRAKLMAAVYSYQLGDYQKALTMLQAYDRKDDVIGATSYALEGDCYVNLDKLSEALDCYDKAISRCDQNPMLMPYFLMKKASVYRAQKNYQAEADIYQQLLDEYPQYGVENGIDFEKYLERAKNSK